MSCKYEMALAIYQVNSVVLHISLILAKIQIFQKKSISIIYLMFAIQTKNAGNRLIWINGVWL